MRTEAPSTTSRSPLSWLAAVRRGAGRALLASAGILLGLQLSYMLLILLACSLYSVANPPLTGLIMYRALVSGHRVEPLRFVPIEQVPRDVQRMFVKVEDYTFYEHHGLDLQAIRDAYDLNRRLGRVYWGGSTITQQLARTLFLTPQRTYLRKYLEAIAALEMELVLSKQRILELYVNYIEFGRGVFGLGTAAFHYYGKPVGRLTRDQARRLVALVASPIRFGVDTLEGSRALAERYRYLSEAFP
jgi:monofunctional biosynthetic peptidoglycan transglycosylase